jgi:hypothetical protein
VINLVGNFNPSSVTDPQGGILLSWGSYRFPLTTFISVPGGGWVKFGKGSNPILATITNPVKANLLNWQIVNSQFIATRTVARLNGRIQVSDTITNLTSSDLGFMVRNEVSLPSDPTEKYIGGNNLPALLQMTQPEHPTVFVPMGGVSLGLVAEDDVFRAQNILYCFNQIAGIRTERLVVKAKSSVTLKWSCYFSAMDYWGFINRVRKDWKVSPTLQGPYWWLPIATAEALDDATLGNWLNKAKPYAAVIESWLDFSKPDKPPMVGLGVGIQDPYFDNWRDKVIVTIQRIKKLAPFVKVLVYNHRWYNFPQNSGTFPDSQIKLADGTQSTENWGGMYSNAYGVYPTLTNSFGKAFEAMITTQTKELGSDGVYVDEYYRSGSLNDPITYSEWDGVSAILDPTTFTIKTKVGYIWLLSKAFDKAVFGPMKYFLGNVQPYTIEDNQGTLLHMCETEYLPGTMLTHLFSPIAFDVKFQTYTVQDIIDRLKLGAVYGVTGPGDKLGISSKLFPITPTYIEAGVITGVERIITCITGRYGWNGSFKYTRYDFDSLGNMATASGVGVNNISVVVPSNGLVVIQKN